MDLTPLFKRDLDRRWVLLTCVFVFLASLALYGKTFSFDFTRYDDHEIIGGHPQLYSEGTVHDRIKQILYKDFPREEPLIVRDLSWLADSLIFGFNRPFGYHYFNVIYHSLGLVLAFLLVFGLTNFGTALIATIVLMSLAAHVEPVAWIMGRKDVLSTVFALLAIILFLRFQDAKEPRLRYLYYLFSLALSGAAYLSKVNSVVLPGVLLLCALINQEEVVRGGIRAGILIRRVLRVFLQVLPFLVLAVAVFFWYRSVLTQFGLLGKALEYSPEQYGKLIFVLDPLIFLEYLKIIFAPSNLEAYYSAPSIFTEFSGFEISLAILVTATTAAAVVFLWRFNRVACLFFLCFIVALLPYGNWVHLGFWYANRYAYFASIFLIAAVVSVSTSSRHIRGARVIKPLLTVFIAWVLFNNFTYRSEYLGVWENGETLWKHETSLPGASIHDYNNLTAYYLGRSESSGPNEKALWLQKAQAANDEALDLDVPFYEMPWLAVAHYYRGLILAYSGAPLESQLAEFMQAVQMSTGYSRALKSTGIVYYQMARQELDPIRRAELSRLSLSYLLKSFESQADSPSSRVEQKRLLDRLKTDFPDLAIEQPSAPGGS